MALAMVVMVTAIMFLLATTVLSLVAYRESQTNHYIARTQAMHVADAGINEYLYQLSRDYTFWITTPTVGPVQMQDGSWKVTATQVSGEPLRLVSVGTLKDGTHRTINATVVFPTFADNVFTIDQADLTIGNGAVITGKVWCNQSIDNDGVIEGLATAVGLCGPTPVDVTRHYKGGYVDSGHHPGTTLGPQRLDFTKVTFTTLKAAATKSGTYFGDAANAGGYEVVFNGNQATVYKISAINYRVPDTTSAAALGKRTTTPATPSVVTIPASGVLYFDDDVWVSGVYSANVTLASSKNIYIPGNFLPSPRTSNYTAGLVTPGYIYFPYWCASVPALHEVQCALMSQGNKVGAQWTGTGAGYANTQAYSSGSWRSTTIRPATKTLDFDGSFSMVKQQGFVMNEGSSSSQGYAARNYSGDGRLMANPPPLYPQIPGGHLRVDTWLEN